MILPPHVSPQDIELLVRDKYPALKSSDASLYLNKEVRKDIERLAAGEPLAYVIGWIPFLGLEIGLASKPLIPRPETEWWTELLVEHLLERFGDAPFTFLDLCAGSGAIGLAVLSKLPNAYVTFSELVPAHAELIEANIERNELDPGRSGVCIGNLFYPLEDRRFDVIASNPPYVPSERVLDASVVLFEPKEALVSGEDGLNVIRKIAASVPVHLAKEGELWLEADIDNIKEAQRLLIEGGAKRTVIRTDLYGRERLVLAFY